MRQRLIKYQTPVSRDSKKNYWDYTLLHGRRVENGEAEEYREANPDILTEDSAMYHVDEDAKEVQGRVHTLLDMSKQILTEQQYNVFVMLAVKEPHFTEREAARVMGVSHQRVHQLWTTAQEKLQKAYKDRT